MVLCAAMSDYEVYYAIARWMVEFGVTVGTLTRLEDDLLVRAMEVAIAIRGVLIRDPRLRMAVLHVSNDGLCLSPAGDGSCGIAIGDIVSVRVIHDYDDGVHPELSAFQLFLQELIRAVE